MEAFAGRVLFLLCEERDEALRRAAMNRENGREWAASSQNFHAERLQGIIARVLEMKEDLAEGAGGT